MTQLKYEEDHSPMRTETPPNAQVSPTSPQADLAFRNNERRGLCGPTPSNSDTAFDLDGKSEARFCPSNDAAQLGAVNETTHSNANERIGMPVPAPAAPPSPEVCRAPPIGVGHGPSHADVTLNVDPKRMDGREDEEYGYPDETNWQKADGFDPVHRNQLGRNPSRWNATDTTCSDSGVHISMPRARMDCRQDAEPPSASYEAPPKYTDGSARGQRQPYHFNYSQPQQSTNRTGTNAQRPSRRPKRSQPPSAIPSRRLKRPEPPSAIPSRTPKRSQLLAPSAIPSRKPKFSQKPSDKEQLPAMFFSNATNVVITGNPSFNYYEGDVCVVKSYTTSTNTNTTTTSGGSGNGYGWPQASMNSNSNTGTRSSRGPHVGHHVEINLGNDWPFGANSTPHFAQPAKGKVTTLPRNRSQSSSMAVGSTATDPRHTDGKDDRDGYVPTHPDGADGPVEKNPYACYGGDRYGNGMSNFEISRANIQLVNGDLVEYDPGTLYPLKPQGDPDS